MKFNKRKIHTLIEYQFNPKTKEYDLTKDEFYHYEGDVASAGGQPTLEASDWAFYEDGTESGSVIIGTKNNDQTLNVDTIYLARFGLYETAGNNWNNGTIQLQYNHNGGGWNEVNGVSSVVQSIATGNIADGDNTTQRITAFTFITANGSFDEVDGVTGALTIGANGTETLYAIQILSADVANNDTIDFKITEGGGNDFDVVPTWPTITVNEGADVNIDAGVDALIQTPYNPTLNAETSFTTTLESLTLTEYNPTLKIDTSFTTTLEQLTLTTYSPTLKIDTSFTATLEALTLTPYAADVTFGVGIDTTLDSLTLTPYNPTLEIDTSFTTTLESLTLTEYNPTLNAETSFTTTLDSLILTDYNPALKIDTSFTTTLDSLTLTAYNAGITTGANVNINADIDALTLTTYNPTLNAETSFTTTLDTLTLTEYNATVDVSTGTNINASVQVINLTEYKATITATAAVEESGTAGGFYKRKHSRPLKTLDYYERLAKELIEEEKQEEEKLKKLESGLNDKKITVLLNHDPDFDTAKSEQKIIKAQIAIVEIKSKIIKSQQTLDRIQRKLDEAQRIAEIIKDDEDFLRHYLMVS